MEHPSEPHGGDVLARLNWLRAAVLGANDGIVSLAALLAGLVAASASLNILVTVGIAALIANALSMAVGEYVSVSSQRDSEKALIAKEKEELATKPEHELEELIHIYEKKGLARATAEQVAKELTAHDAFAAHADAELGINPHNLTNPLHAGVASAIAFSIGGAIPILATLLVPSAARLYALGAATIIALVITGTLSAQAGGASKSRATLRVVLGGIIAMAATFAVGSFFGVANV